MGRTPDYTDEQKAEIVAWYIGGHSAAETAAKFGCGQGSVSRWAKRAGQSKPAALTEQTEAAHAAQVAYARQRRSEARKDLADALAGLAKMVAGVHALQPREMWQVATTIEVLTKVIRLEDGEATGRDEVVHTYEGYSDADLIAEAERIVRDAAERQTD